MLVPLIVVLAIADDVHIIQHWDEVRRHLSARGGVQGRRSRTSPRRSSARAAPPRSAWLSLATSNVVAVRSFGIGSAVGDHGRLRDFARVRADAAEPVKPETAEPPQERYLIEPMRPRRDVLDAAAAAGPDRRGLPQRGRRASASCGCASTPITSTSSARTIRSAQSARIIDGELSGIYSFQILLEGPPESLRTPDSLRRMRRSSSRSSRELAEREEGHARSPTTCSRVNKELHDGDPAADVVPADRRDRRAGAVRLHARRRRPARARTRSSPATTRARRSTSSSASMSSDVVLSSDRARASSRDGSVRRHRRSRPTTTGSGRLFSTLDHYLVQSQLSSFATAFFTVFGVIFVIFRSARFGFLTIAPNVLPGARRPRRSWASWASR